MTPPRTSRVETVLRWALAGPGALLVAIVAMAAMPVWFPRSAAGIDHVAFPLVLFPVFWAAPLFYVLLTERLVRAALILTGLTVTNAAIAYSSGGWS